MRGLGGWIAAGAAAFLLVLSGGASAFAAVAEEDAYAIGVDAYLYLYPLVLMEKTRSQATNVAPGQRPARAPTNAFRHVPVFPPASFRAVVRPNFDTLYSVAWLDLAKEPMILSVPDTAGRYYLLPMLDMWTDVFAVVGKRTTGTGAGSYAIAAPGWQGRLPEGIERIDAPTRTVWVIGRTQTNGPSDYAAVRAVQAGYRLTPLSQWQGGAQPPVPAFDPSVDMTTPPPHQVAALPAAQFFTLGMALLRREGPHLVDQPILARMKRIGLDAAGGFDFAALDPGVQRALDRAVHDALKLTAGAASARGRVLNGWRMETDATGVYGTSYLRRAIVARNGLGANLPQDSVYAGTSVDGDGTALDGANRYVIRFEKGELPPVSAFWSITLYDSEGYPAANPLDRFAIGDRDGLASSPDGSLEIIVAGADPGPDKRSNWLPAPAGSFNLTLRLYGPERSVLDGAWLPPRVQRLP